MRAAIRDFALAVLRPVAINLLTGFVLFVVALAFKSDILRLFGLDRAHGYPIVCAAEMYQAPEGNRKVRLDFYLINNSGTWFDERIDLVERLAEKNPDADLDLSPDIQFTVNARLADGFSQTEEMDRATDAFNKGKGEAHTSISDDGRTVSIQLVRIAPYSVLKATVALEGYSYDLGDDRGLVPLLPIERRDTVFERCYTVVG
jgi:hypothetical protein